MDGCVRYEKPEPNPPARAGINKGGDKEWRAVHLFAPWHNEMPLFKRVISEKLAPMGVNVLIIEVNCKYAFESHPELREPGNSLTKADARELAELCRKHSIRLIPEFNCLGHQSWDKTTFPLLVKYPELDETPNIPKDNKGIYCRSWCPLHPRTNEIVFPLLNELIDAFQADAFHVGMDEVFLIASDQCPRCKGKDPAELFAKAVNDYHKFLVDEKKLTMLMWGDRLIDRRHIDYGGGYECSDNGTARAIELIPKDIVICDWHYESREEYPSVRFFQEQGFRVMPSTWRNLKATKAFIEYAQRTRTDRMIGYLFTTWYGAQDMCPALLGEGNQSKLPAGAIEAAATLREGMKEVTSGGK
jgi:hypothetical protein